MAMPFGAGTFDIVASARLSFHSGSRQSLRRDEPGAAPGGLVAGYTWKRTANTDFAPYAPMMRGVKSIGAEPQVSPLVPEGSAEGMRASLQSASFADIAVTEIEVTRTFKNFDDIGRSRASHSRRQARPSRNSTTRSARDCAT